MGRCECNVEECHHRDCNREATTVVDLPGLRIKRRLCDACVQTYIEDDCWWGSYVMQMPRLAEDGEGK